MREQIILYQPDGVKISAAGMLGARLKVRVRAVGADALDRTPAEILGIKTKEAGSTAEARSAAEPGRTAEAGAEASRESSAESGGEPVRESGAEENERYQQPLLLFCGVPDSVLSAFLEGLRKQNVKIPLKAWLTEENSGWTLKRLYRELKAEHESLTGERLL